MGRPGLEMIVGGRNDPDWGAVVLAGLGSVQAELLKDTCLTLPGRSPDAVMAALCALRGGALLLGYRGSPPLDLLALADLIIRVGKLLRAEPGIRKSTLIPSSSIRPVKASSRSMRSSSRNSQPQVSNL